MKVEVDFGAKEILTFLMEIGEFTDLPRAEHVLRVPKRSADLKAISIMPLISCNSFC